jgi:hypothetical protein
VLHVTGDGGSAGEHSAEPAWRRTLAAFGDWRRTRPFWGGLFLLASGLEFYVSGHLDLLPLKVSFGPQSFLGWLIPLALVLCGLLVWYTPAQRVFYGILGAAISVAALIGLNLGGFFVGMVFGIVGGALAFSWSPDVADPDAAADLPEPDADPDASEPEPGVGSAAPGFASPESGFASPESGVTSPQPGVTSPGSSWPEGGGRHAAGPSDPSGRLLSLILLIIVVTAGLVVLPAPRPAVAAPCPAPSSSVPTPGRPAPSRSTPSQTPPPGNQGGGGFFDWLGRVLGIGGAPSPSQSVTPSPSRTGPVRSPVPVPSAGKPCGPPAPPGRGGPARTLPVPPGQPVVNSVPSKQITARLSQSGLSYDGIVDLPTHTGTLRALQFSLKSSTSTPFELQVPAPGGTISLRSSKLTVSGQVRFYTSEIKGKLFGLVPVTFTPESPPPLVVPELFFTDATVQLVFVSCDRLTAPALHIAHL